MLELELKIEGNRNAVAMQEEQLAMMQLRYEREERDAREKLDKVTVSKHKDGSTHVSCMTN